jgi:hypothetical protein
MVWSDDLLMPHMRRISVDGEPDLFVQFPA